MIKRNNTIYLHACLAMGGISSTAFAESVNTPVVDTLSEVVVTANAEKSGLTEPFAGNQVASGSRLGILGDKEIADTPYSTVSYTSEYIKNKQDSTVGEVLQRDPTVRVARGFGNFQEAYFIRGFITTSDDTMFNGLYGVMPRQRIPTELFERVELQRGSSASLNGSAPSGGNVGGTINLLPKRAPNEDLREITVGYGAGNRGNIAVDLGKRFGQNGEFGVRANAAYHDGKTSIDNEKNNLRVASLGLDYRRENVRLSADLGYQNNKLTQPRTNVKLKKVDKVPDAPDMSSNWAQPWTFSNENNIFGTLRGELDLTDNSTIYAAYGFRNGAEENSLANLTVKNINGDGSQYRFDNSRKDNIRTGEVGIKGQFDTGSVGHNAVLSANMFNKIEKGAYAFDWKASFNNNLYNHEDAKKMWSQDTVFAGDLDAPQKVGDISLKSVAVADTLYMLDGNLQTTIGLRHQTVKTKTFDYKTHTKTSEYDKNKITPTFAVVYTPTENWSVYGNYIESLTPGKIAPAKSGGQPVVNAGEQLDPYVSKQGEIGVKFTNENIGMSLSAYQINQPRVAHVGDNLRFASKGKNQHSGGELTVFGSPADNLRLMGGFTYLKAIQKDTGDNKTDGKRVIGVPNFQGNIGVEYDVAQIPNLTLLGDVNYTGSRYVDSANKLKADSFTTLDIGARYDLDLGGTDMIIKGTIDNVNNAKYWKSAGGFTGRGYLNAGDPRSVKLSATVNF